MGAIPVPMPTRVIPSAVRDSSEKIPYGPSMATRVPGRTSSRARVPLPRALTVTRSVRPSGAAETLNGCWCHHSPGARKRQ